MKIIAAQQTIFPPPDRKAREATLDRRMRSEVILHLAASLYMTVASGITIGKG